MPEQFVISKTVLLNLKIGTYFLESCQRPKNATLRVAKCLTKRQMLASIAI